MIGRIKHYVVLHFNKLMLRECSLISLQSPILLSQKLVNVRITSVSVIPPVFLSPLPPRGTPAIVQVVILADSVNKVSERTALHHYTSKRFNILITFSKDDCKQ